MTTATQSTHEHHDLLVLINGMIENLKQAGEYLNQIQTARRDENLDTAVKMSADNAAFNGDRHRGTMLDALTNMFDYLADSHTRSFWKSQGTQIEEDRTPMGIRFLMNDEVHIKKNYPISHAINHSNDNQVQLLADYEAAVTAAEEQVPALIDMLEQKGLISEDVAYLTRDDLAAGKRKLAALTPQQ